MQRCRIRNVESSRLVEKQGLHPAVKADDLLTSVVLHLNELLNGAIWATSLGDVLLAAELIRDQTSETARASRS